MMAAFTAAPRLGHFDAMLHIFAFLHHHPRSRLVFDDRYFECIEKPAEHDWREFYPDAFELLPPNAPHPLGKPIEMVAFVDSDHAGDMLTRRSRTGVLEYYNRSPILWYSKKQNGIEPSTFGSEFMGLKVATDLAKDLRYKCQIMGIPLDGPTIMGVDNQLVVNNTMNPSSVARLEDLIWRQPDMETFARLEDLIWRKPDMKTFARLEDLIWRQPDMETFARLEDLVWRKADMETT
jgi:hypothetical protein